MSTCAHLNYHSTYIKAPDRKAKKDPDGGDYM